MQTNKTLRAIVLIGIFILPFIFLWNPSNMFFPYITGKNFAFRIIVEITASLWAILALRSSEFRPKRAWIFWTYAAFISILVAADLTGLDPSRSFWSNSERMDGLITQLHLFLYFVVACAMLNSEKLWEWFLETSIVASVYMSFSGLFQLIGSKDSIRVDGGFGNPTYLAVYLLFHIFFILYLLAKHWKESSYRWLLIPAAIFESFILYYTATRGDLLGLGFGLLLTALIIAIFEKGNATLRKFSFVIIVAAVVVVLGFLAIKNTDFVKKSPVLSRFASISATDTTTESRLMIWNMAFQGFEERPILGWGQENFNLVFSKYYNPNMWNQEPWFDRAHNVFFDWLVDGGILGLLGYLALFGVGIWTLFRNPRFTLSEKAILTGLFAGYFFQNLFVFDNIGSYFMFFTLLAFVSYGSDIGHSAETVPVRNLPKNSGKPAVSRSILDSNLGLVQILTILVVFAGASAVYFLNVPQIEANTTLIAALQSGDISKFQVALSYNSLAQDEIREQLLQAALGTLSSSALTQDQKLSAINFAISEMKKQIAETPLDIRAKLLYSSLLEQVGLPDEALAVLKIAHDMSPKKQPILFNIASAYLEKKDYADALSAAKEAYDLAPADSQAASIYAAVAIYAGKQSDADSVFKAFPDLEASDESVLQAYAASGQYAKVSAIWKIRFAKDPANPDLHVTYSTLLVQMGRKSEAVSELNKALSIESSIEKDPAAKKKYASGIQALIAQIQKGN